MKQLILMITIGGVMNLVHAEINLRPQIEEISNLALQAIQAEHPQLNRNELSLKNVFYMFETDSSEEPLEKIEICFWRNKSTERMETNDTVVIHYECVSVCMSPAGVIQDVSRLDPRTKVVSGNHSYDYASRLDSVRFRANPESGMSNEQMTTVRYCNARIDNVLQYYANLTGKDVIQDRGLRGSVTVASENEMSLFDAVELLNTALEAQNIQLIKIDEATIKATWLNWLTEPQW